VYTYTCTYICIYVYICIRICIYIYTCMHIYAGSYIYIYIYRYIYIYITVYATRSSRRPYILKFPWDHVGFPTTENQKKNESLRKSTSVGFPLSVSVKNSTRKVFSAARAMMLCAWFAGSVTRVDVTVPRPWYQESTKGDHRDMRRYQAERIQVPGVLRHSATVSFSTNKRGYGPREFLEFYVTNSDAWPSCESR